MADGAAPRPRPARFRVTAPLLLSFAAAALLCGVSVALGVASTHSHEHRGPRPVDAETAAAAAAEAAVSEAEREATRPVVASAEAAEQEAELPLPPAHDVHEAEPEDAPVGVPPEAKEPLDAGGAQAVVGGGAEEEGEGGAPAHEARFDAGHFWLEAKARRAPDGKGIANLRKAVERTKAGPLCMGAPEDLLPTFTNQPDRPNAPKSRQLPAKTGYVGVAGVGGGASVRAKTENGPRKASVEAVPKRPRLLANEDALVKCLRHLGRCTPEAHEAALHVRGMHEARLGKPLAGLPRLKSCAVVGNAGSLLLKEYGPWIDKHDAVIRINVLENKKYVANLGHKATHRVLSFKMSKDVCCIMPANKHPPDNPKLTFLVWFPAHRKEVATRLRRRYSSNPVKEMSDEFLNSAIGTFKTMREELVRMGFGPFEDWEYMTSGMHAVLAFMRSCERLDVYGMTTDATDKGPYWFTGRKVAPRSGRSQHSWDHERMILRLLAAAGHVNICS